HRRRPAPPFVCARHPRGRPDGVRGRGLFCGDGAGGARIRGCARGAPDRPEHGGVHLHGARRPPVRGGGARRAPRPPGAFRRGWTAIAMGVGFMAAAATVFLLVPGALVRAFTSDRAVIEIGTALLFVAAVFQLFDGVQGVTTGALRGLGDTHTAMLWNLGGHWIVGLPLGYLLCFRRGDGVVGLWWGLSVGLIIGGVALLAGWTRKRSRIAPLVPYADRQV